jgi:hypothetical protein
VGFPIRKSPDQSSFAAPRRLSQRITSFIACACQGIHQLPLRHLIIHIANTHPGPKGRMKQAILKRPASRDLSDGAVRQTNHGQGIERPPATNRQPLTDMARQHPSWRRERLAMPRSSEPEQIFSLRCHTEQANGTRPFANLAFLSD